MKAVGHLLWMLAIITLPFAIFQVIGPLKQFGGWFSDAVDPNVKFLHPSGSQIFFDACRQMTISLELLSVPLVLWVIGNMAVRADSRNEGQKNISN
jgi:hypothetical protein